jgi:hypothetical protein
MHGVDTAGALTNAGSMTAATGAITATAGNVSAEGDPASDQARLKGKQFVMNGSTPTGSVGDAVNGAGVDGSVTIVGNDVRGYIEVVTGAAVGVAGEVITVVDFNKDYPGTPFPVISAGNIAAATLASQPHVAATTANFTLTLGATALTAGGGAGGTYIWTYHIIG